MISLVEILFLILIGLVLVWSGYTLFFIVKKQHKHQKPVPEGKPGESQTCPVCGARLLYGERVKSSIFPSLNGKERMMYIYGCPYCLSEERQRSCPVCGSFLHASEYLIARFFEKPARPHVHILGCTQCRKPGK